MRMDRRCFQCLLSRVRFECSLVLPDEAGVEDIVNRCCQVLEEARTWEIPAPRIATEVHRTAYRLTGSVDPYLSLKQQNNEVARMVCRSVRPMLHTFRDRVLASIIG
ncbi:MAG: ARMT1-like domain-containing protein, partial [Methanomicrobiales archaeon]|nr:ARMT1-like domain-containing protein [Methanomicrobiales archaeon]